jgi:apolipoprotein N-acyltransferase
MKKLPMQILVSSMSGILVALSFPPVGWWPCSLIAWGLLLAVVTRTTSRRSFYLGLLQGMLAYGISLSWLVNIFGPRAGPLIGILALFVAFSCLLTTSTAGLVANPAARALYVAMLWTAIEYIRCELFILRFTWITPGLAIGPTFLTPVIGVYGLSFFVFLGSALLLHARSRIHGSLIAAVVLILGMVRPPAVMPSERIVRVAAVQKESCPLVDYLEMTAGLSNESPDIVVWPEYAVQYDIRGVGLGDMESIHQLARLMDTIIVFGTRTEIPDSEGEWHNTALTVNGDGILGEYYKNRPVHFFNDGTPGTSVTPVATPFGAVGTPICFDFDYTAVMRRMSAEGAELFLVPSFDEKTWSRKQHLQHSAILPVRAAENGKWVVCAASSGTSQIIDPNGRRHVLLNPMIEGVIAGNVELRSARTFYVTAGWLFPWVCLLLSAGWIVLLQLRRLRGRQAHHQHSTSS